MHWVKGKETLERWHTRLTLRNLNVVGFVSAVTGVTALIWYLFLTFYYKIRKHIVILDISYFVNLCIKGDNFMLFCFEPSMYLHLDLIYLGKCSLTYKNLFIIVAIRPISESTAISAIWSMICGKWGVTLMYYSNKYELLIQEGASPILTDSA